MKGRIFLFVAALAFVLGIIVSGFGIAASGATGVPASEVTYVPLTGGTAGGCC